jgi:hypothetical protein
VIPTEALIKSSGKEGVFVVEKDPASEKNIARFNSVETGISTGMETEIISPEIKGPVITLGQHLLQDGGYVTLSETSGAPASGKDGGRSLEMNEERGR